MNTFVFNLNVTCTRNPEAVKGETDPKKLYLNEAGTSSPFPSPFRLSLFRSSATFSSLNETPRSLIPSLWCSGFVCVVYSGDMTWEPAGRQKNLFKDTPARPVLDDILVAKLRPGQVRFSLLLLFSPPSFPPCLGHSGSSLPLSALGFPF